MKKHYNYLTIDLDKKVYNKLKAMQYDTKSRYILINLISNNSIYDLTDTTVKIYGVKNDKTIFFNNAVIIDATKGQFEIELTNQALAVEGQLEIQILVLGATGEKLTSSSFYIEVGKSIIDENAIESTNEFNALTEGLKNLAEYDVYRQNVNNNKKNIEEHSKKLDEHSSQIKDKANLNNIEKHIYVTNFGDDITGDGSETNPFATIQKAIDSIDVLTKKDIIVHVSDGIYNTSSEFDEWGRDVLTNLTGKNYSSKRTSNTDLQNKYGKLIIEGNGVNTILDGDNKSKRIGIYAHCNTDVVIKNINFKNFVSGVASHEFSVVTVKGCTFENCTNGILAENMAKVEAGYNTFINCENDFYSKNGQIQNNYSTHNNSVCVVSSEGSPYHLLSKLTCNNVKSFLKNKGDGYIQVNDSNFVGDNTNDFYEGIANYLYLNRCKISKFSTVFDARGGKVEVVSCNIFNNGFVVYNTIGNADIMFSNCNSNNESGVEIPNTQATPFRINNHTTLQFSGTNTIKPYKVLYNPPSDSMFLYGSSIPSTGYHFKGKVCFNTAPVSGQPIGWVCSVAGEPGTWLPLPNLG